MRPETATSANYAPLTPLSLLRRTAEVHPRRIAVRHGEITFCYADLYARAKRLGAALVGAGVRPGDVVSILAPNTPAHLEAHFGVAMAGAVLNSINMRLDQAAVAYILRHSEARVLLVDEEFTDLARDALASLDSDVLVVGIADAAVARNPVGPVEYEAWLAGAPDLPPIMPADEGAPIALNYTSGTTGRPRGVIYDHRGAYLNAIGNTLAWPMDKRAVYLWTLPMFHCNGWCFPWTVTALGGTHVCLRRPSPTAVLAALRTEGVTHLCGAPIILSSLASAVAAGAPAPPQGVRVMTAGAAPPAAVIEGIEALGFEVTHTYGLTEVFGPCVICEWDDGWNALPLDERAALKARQGVRYALQEDVDVLDPSTMGAVASDGVAVGEVMIRGNIVMRRYFKDEAATAEAFSGGWFHTGDLAVKHADGYIQIRDRSKDVIISGGENISSLEIEEVLHQHPAIADVAVVARQDARWGETPCAFVTLHPGHALNDQEALAFCRERLAGFKVPKTFVFGDLPRTPTGKVQKFRLRERASELPS